jgi:hypothetical protein
MTPPSDSVQRDIGKLIAEHEAVKEDLRKIHQQIETISKDVAEIKTFVSETKGGRTYLWAALSLAAALGATITQTVNVLKFWQ